VIQQRALITGITGQDGAYLAQHLLAQGYQVSGLSRPQSDLWRLHHLGIADQVAMLPLNIDCSAELASMLAQFQPAQVYHLAAQSSVTHSFEQPLLSGVHLLEAIRTGSPHTRFFYACSSEMFGHACGPLSEEQPLAPCSPYACAKAYGYHLVKTYRQAYGTFACSGILFNHESPLRGPQFVTRKITAGLARLQRGPGEPLHLGNLDSQRDWGYAPEYVEAMTRMLQADQPDDFVLATGQAYTVRDFCEFAARACGFDLVWERHPTQELGRDRTTGRVLIESEADWHRPNDIAARVGNPGKALRLLGWQARTTAPRLAALMVESELSLTQAQKV
jgi:GDPmannose 4,6-dehydratase